jgi:hypothetical protein
LGFAFECGQIEIRFTMHVRCNRLDLGGANAPLPEQARGSTASAQQAKQKVKGGRCSAIGRGQGSRFG